jgi:putative tRNA adenosine deaminase-associated protein
VEDVADRLRDVEPEAEVSLLFVESDDAYLVILRLDEGEDLRVFGSDAAFAEESRLGALLLGEIEEPVPDLDAETAAASTEEGDEESSPPPDSDPVGDADLLTDLGLPASRLLAICAHEGLLPSDMTAEVCQAIGCGDEIEELREA